MPLKKGSSHKTVSHNVTEMVHAWKKNGKIGTSRPIGKKKAVKQAVAIALDKSREAKRPRLVKKNTASAAKKSLRLIQP